MRMERYKTPCAVDGCTSHPTGRGLYCPAHNHINSRRGHPQQAPVYKYLTSHIQRVTSWANTLEGSKALEATVSLYEKQSLHYRSLSNDSYESMMRTGVRSTSPHSEMADLIAGVSRAKNTRKTIVQMIAIGLMLNEDPGSFKSDNATLYETANVYLRGSLVNGKMRFNKTTGAVQREGKYLRQSTKKMLGQWLMTNWVVLGITLSREWNRRLALELREKRELTDLIKASA